MKASEEREIMQAIRDEFTANAEHFDSVVMKLLNQNERLLLEVERVQKNIKPSLQGLRGLPPL